MHSYREARHKQVISVHRNSYSVHCKEYLPNFENISRFYSRYYLTVFVAKFPFLIWLKLMIAGTRGCWTVLSTGSTSQFQIWGNYLLLKALQCVTCLLDHSSWPGKEIDVCPWLYRDHHYFQWNATFAALKVDSEQTSSQHSVYSDVTPVEICMPVYRHQSADCVLRPRSAARVRAPKCRRLCISLERSWVSFYQGAYMEMFDALWKEQLWCYGDSCWQKLQRLHSFLAYQIRFGLGCDAPRLYHSMIDLEWTAASDESCPYFQVNILSSIPWHAWFVQHCTLCEVGWREEAVQIVNSKILCREINHLVRDVAT